MACRGLGAAACARRDPVAVAIGGAAEIRSALHDTLLLCDGCLIAGATLAGERAAPERVLAPLPDIAHHVEQARGVRRERLHGGGAKPSVGSGVHVRKPALPDGGEERGVGRLVVTPRVAPVLRSAARGVLPVGFRGQAAAAPNREGGGVVPR